MVKDNPNSVIVESGNVSNSPDRLSFIASLMHDMGYDAVGVGETDLRIFGSKYFEQMAENKITVLDTFPRAKTTALPYLIKTVGGVKVGVISFGATPSDDSVSDLEKRKAVFIAYKAVREASDVLVVLDESNTVKADWLERMGKRFGEPDIVIGGAMRAYTPQEEIIGRAHLVQTSLQGKQIGVVDVEIVPGQLPKLSSKRIALEPPIEEDPVVNKKVKEFMAKIQPAPTYNPPIAGTVQTAAAGGKPYYPPSLCRTCHIKEYEDWKTTKHAVAIKTLLDEQRAIPECLKCHSEQFRRLQRVTFSPDHVGGVECATCHMNSLPHGMERKGTTAKVKVDTKGCIECHDRENSPKYDEKSYTARVSHAGASDAASTTTSAPSLPKPPLPGTPPAPPSLK